MENKEYFDASKLPSRIALIYFNTLAEAEQVIARTDQKIFQGKRLNVVLARPTLIMPNERLLKVTGLNKNVTEEDLYREFFRCGDIERLVKSNSTTAYITFKDEAGRNKGVWFFINVKVFSTTFVSFQP